MSLKNSILLLVIFGLTACQNVERTPKPKNLIPEGKMVKVLVDMVKIDAVISLDKPGYRDRGSIGKTLIFNKYEIDSTQLAQSNAYYAEHFTINQRIYDSVRVVLDREKDSLFRLKEQREAAEKDQKK